MINKEAQWPALSYIHVLKYLLTLSFLFTIYLHSGRQGLNETDGEEFSLRKDRFGLEGEGNGNLGIELKVDGKKESLLKSCLSVKNGGEEIVVGH